MKQIAKTLLRTPAPYPDESLAGYVLRLSESNYYQSPHWIMNLANLKADRTIRLPFKSKKPSQLSQVIGISDIQLRKMAYGAVIDKDTFSYSIHRYAKKICQQCLRETLYCRQIWELPILEVCPFHDCLLLQVCPSCQKQISWSRPGVAKCKCGQDFRNCAVKSAAPYQVNFAVYVHGMKGNTPCLNQIREVYGEDNPVFELDLVQFRQFSWFLCSRLLSELIHQISDKIERLISINVEEQLTLSHRLAIVFCLFKDWTRNFSQIFDWKLNLHMLRDRREMILNYFVIFLVQLTGYFKPSSIFTKHHSVYLRQKLLDYQVNQIKLVWSEKKLTRLFCGEISDIESFMEKTKVQLKLPDISFLELIDNCFDVELIFSDHYNQPISSGTLILKELSFWHLQPKYLNFE